MTGVRGDDTIMISRNFRIALIISLCVHIFGMTVVTIINPGGIERKHPYTRIEFLGSILRKTAFDIMLDVNPVMIADYEYGLEGPDDSYLEVEVSRIENVVGDFSRRRGSGMDSDVLGFLEGSKAVPDFHSKLKAFETDAERRVIYKPEAPSFELGVYGDQKEFKVKIRVFVEANGSVKRTEPLATTGYPGLDQTAEKFVRSWIFEPNEYISDEDEWLTVEVVLRRGS